MTRETRSRRLATTVLALTLVIGVGACDSPAPSPSTTPGPSASSTPTPTRSPAAATATPTASPTPRVDAARTFLAILSSRTFAATAKITGELTVGSATFPVSGTYDVRGADNRQSFTIAVPGASQATQSMTVGGVAYVMHDGLWFVKPAAPAGSTSNADLASSLRSLLDLVDTGTVTRGGRTLHHLEPRGDASIPLSAIGASDPTGDGVVALDFYAEEDGTPVVMTIAATWTQPSGKTTQRASMTVDYTFSNVGGQIVIAAPQQVWATFKSKRFGYSTAYPVDWEAKQSPRKTQPDTIISYEETGFVGIRTPTGGYSLNSLTSGYITWLKRTGSKVSVTSNNATTLDGAKARKLEWTGIYDGSRAWHVDVVVVRGKYVYVFDYVSLSKLSDGDRALFDGFVSSMALPKP